MPPQMNETKAREIFNSFNWLKNKAFLIAKDICKKNDINLDGFYFDNFISVGGTVTLFFRWYNEHGPTIEIYFPIFFLFEENYFYLCENSVYYREEINQLKRNIAKIRAEEFDLYQKLHKKYGKKEE